MNNLQRVILEIFKEIKKVCETNGISYCAIGGTCIGAVRHNGFIPWDDDLDIAIPIEQFYKFIDCARKELPSWLYVYTDIEIRHYMYPFIKVCDSRTTFVEKSDLSHPDSFKGVFVDIMPLSGVPSTGEQEKFISKLDKYFTNNFFLRFRDKYNTIAGFLYRIPYRILSLFVPDNYFSNKYIDLLKSYPLGKSEFTGYVWECKMLRKLIFPSAWFASYVELPFEDTTMRCPIEYDKYLSQQFGEYMKLPPVEQQMTHNFFVDLERSYVEYQKNGIPSLSALK